MNDLKPAPGFNSYTVPERWQHELRSLPRAALCIVVEHLVRVSRSLSHYPLGSDLLLNMELAKKRARYDSAQIACMRMEDDFDAYMESFERRHAAAKKAARRRKKGGSR